MRLFLALLLAALVGCAEDPAPTPPPPTDPAPAPAVDGRQSVADVVSANPQLRTLARLLAASGLDATLADTATTTTLFAPTDDAFAALGDDAVAALEADPDAARAALLGHVVATRMLSVDVFPDLSIETVGGSEVSFVEAGDGLAVRSGGTTARITDADLDADNGVVHLIDAVLR
ncbi:fasciclin domain-containing protein [Rubrivirga sp.]|uniref:fasciclin domain-containing protein n=1 Tax=Rubrivirga sp. TaxID=1885344 RepID=UPI003B52027A